MRGNKTWKNRDVSELESPWFSDAVVYQIYPRSFADSNGDGIGDLPGITAHLDHIAWLGADIVWLSPIYCSPQDDNGYDISDYGDIDPVFGTLADFDALCAAVHERGMKLIMDLVVNHTSDEHPWFVESRDPASPKRDWYIWRPAREGSEPGTPGAEPTNWGSFFCGSAWEFDEASKEYYLHLFSRKQPDLNWENPDVRAAIYAMMNEWVARGVDGFRMDVINLISKTYPLADGLKCPGQPYSFEVDRLANGPRLLEFLEEMNHAVGLSSKRLFTVGEMVGCSVGDAREYASRHHNRLNMVFTFEHLQLDQGPAGKLDVQALHLPDLKQNMALWQNALAADGWNSLYFENHDQPRSVSRFGDGSQEHRVASAKALATVLHLHQGTPYIYQGQEIGMTNAGFTSIEQYADVEALGYYKQAMAAGVDAQTVLAGLGAMGRDNARTPMPWTPEGGFSCGSAWLPMNPSTPSINVASDVADPEGVSAYYRELIRLRHELPVVQAGRFQLLLPEHEKLWAFTRVLGEVTMLVIANMSSSPTSVPMSALPEMKDASLLLANMEAERSLQTMQPWESRIYELRQGEKSLLF